MENLLAPFMSAKTKAFSENVWNSSVAQEEWSLKFIDLDKNRHSIAEMLTSIGKTCAYCLSKQKMVTFLVLVEVMCNWFKEKNEW